MRVKPLDAGGEVTCSACGSPMHAEEGYALASQTTAVLIWWRCDEEPRHITDALPLPERN